MTKVLAIVVFLYYFLSLALWSIPMPYAFLSSLLQYCLVLLSLSSACPVGVLKGALLVQGFGSTASFIQCMFALHSGIACLGLCILE